MRKYFVGFLVGAGLMTAFNASAAVESLIGKVIDNQYVVKLDGKVLEKPAVSSEGTSYAPVRAIAESLGLNVEFKDNEVLLNKKNDTTKEVQPAVDTKLEVDKPTIEYLDTKINIAKAQIQGARGGIQQVEKDLKKPELQNREQYETSLRNMKDALAKLETELADLERQKAELESSK